LRPRAVYQPFPPTIVLPAREEDPSSGAKIHILGDDERSRFIAHALSRSYAAVEMLSWKGKPSSRYNNIETLSRRKSARSQKEPTVEPISVASRATTKTKDDSYIENLIVTGRGYEAVPALEEVKHRVDENTTICLMNDGLGVLEDVREKIFAGEMDKQPDFVLGHMNHRLVFNRASNSVKQLKGGSMRLTPAARLSGKRKGQSTEVEKRSRLVERLHNVERLRASTSPLDEWMKFKLPSLVFNAAVEPVCVALDCDYAHIMRFEEGWKLMNSLLREILQVVAHFPEVRYSAGLQDFLKRGNIRDMLVNGITAKRDAPSLFVQQIASRQYTDVDYHNGYFIRRAKKLGVDVPRNEMMRQIIISKYYKHTRDLNRYVPIEETSIPHYLDRKR
jgi:cytochrome b translational activator protein CBS2